MTENQMVDNQEQNGADGLPSTSVSSGNGGSIGDAAQVSKLLKAEIAEALKPVISELRGVQGKADKTGHALQGFLDEYEKGKASGLSNADAAKAADDAIQGREREVHKDALLEQIASKLGLSSAGNGAPAQASISDVLKQFPELDPNDVEVVQNVLTQTDPEKAELAASRLLRKRANPNQPSPSASGTIVTTPAPPAGVEELTKKYQTDMKAAVGNKSLLKSIKEKARKDGVPVDSIAFI